MSIVRSPGRCPSVDRFTASPLGKQTTYDEEGVWGVIDERFKPGDRCIVILENYHGDGEIWVPNDELAFTETEASRIIKKHKRRDAIVARARQLAKTIEPLVLPLIDQLCGEFEGYSRAAAEDLLWRCLTGAAWHEPWHETDDGEPF
jgi:hypothetical protein